jgi:hypothetical protein
MMAKLTAGLGVLIIALSVFGIASEMTDTSTGWPPAGYKDKGDVNVFHDKLEHGTTVKYAGKVSVVTERAVVVDNGSMFIFFEPLGDVKKDDIDVSPGDKVLIEVRVGEFLDCSVNTSCVPNFNHSGKAYYVASWEYEQAAKPGEPTDDTACAVMGLILGGLILFWAYMMHRKDVQRETSSHVTIDRIIKRMDEEDGVEDREGKEEEKEVDEEDKEEEEEEEADGERKGTGETEK